MVTCWDWTTFHEQSMNHISLNKKALNSPRLGRCAASVQTAVVHSKNRVTFVLPCYIKEFWYADWLLLWFSTPHDVVLLMKTLGMKQ